jgi:hypothetical protein
MRDDAKSMPVPSVAAHFVRPSECGLLPASRGPGDAHVSQLPPCLADRARARYRQVHDWNKRVRTMNDTRAALAEKKARLSTLVEQRSKANCDTRHLSPADMKREQEIEELEEQIEELEKRAGGARK